MELCFSRLIRPTMDYRRSILILPPYRWMRYLCVPRLHCNNADTTTHNEHTWIHTTRMQWTRFPTLSRTTNTQGLTPHTCTEHVLVHCPALQTHRDSHHIYALNTSSYTVPQCNHTGLTPQPCTEHVLLHCPALRTHGVSHNIQLW